MMVELGGYAGFAYFWWAFFLLMGCLGVHHAFALAHFLASRYRNPPRGLIAFEVFYGGINPVLYLLVLQPVLFRAWTPGWLPALCWLTWVVFWASRLLADRLSHRWVRSVMIFTFVFVACIALRDAVALFSDAMTVPEKAQTGFLPAIVFAACLPLYLLPLACAWRGIGASTSDTARDDSGFFLPPTSKRVQLVVLMVIGLVAVAALPLRSKREVEAELLEHRELILSVSKEHDLDPRLLAATVSVTQLEFHSPFRARLEELASGAWLVDSKSGLLLAEAIDPSLGLAQVKANTLLTAYAIVSLSTANSPSWLTKEYRSVRHLNGEALQRIPRPELAALRRAGVEPLPRKDEVVRALTTPEGNLAAMAFVLDVVATQWELADPSWSIRQRPEILATLFQLGFERSVPKEDPRSNEFGERVANAMKDAFIEQHFGSGN